AVGVGAEQDDLVGVEFLGDGARVAVNHPPRDVRPEVQPLRRKGKRTWLCPGHIAIVPEGQLRLLASVEARIRAGTDLPSTWQKVKLRKLSSKIEKFKNGAGFDLIAAKLGIPKPRKQ